MALEHGGVTNREREEPISRRGRSAEQHIARAIQCPWNPRSLETMGDLPVDVLWVLWIRTISRPP